MHIIVKMISVVNFNLHLKIFKIIFANYESDVQIIHIYYLKKVVIVIQEYSSHLGI